MPLISAVIQTPYRRTHNSADIGDKLIGFDNNDERKWGKTQYQKVF